MPETEYMIFFNGFDSLQTLETALPSLREWTESVAPWALEALGESPVMAIGLAAILLFPLLAGVGALVRLLASGLTARDLPPRRPPPDPTPYHPPNAVLEIARHGVKPYPIRHGIVRIGRETDNDVCLDHPSVHRYHAIIERTPDAEFHIAYVGDPDGNRLFIDGRPAARQRLLGGEVLDIGAVKLRFTLTASPA